MTDINALSAEKQALHDAQRDQLCGWLDDALTERDRYRAALEEILTDPNGGYDYGCASLGEARYLANRALRRPRA